ncbi:MAG: hypothetical protein HKM06_08865 [Spirochaetales bacterium]|nr:hypothetical protein [Spirochaetales bacterium]
MLGYLVTKTFFDLWDNWIASLVCGLFFWGTTALAFWLGPLGGALGWLIGLMLSLALNAAAAVVFYHVTDPSQEFNVGRAVVAAVLFSLLASGTVLVSALGVWFYSSTTGLLGLSLAFLGLWILLFLAAGSSFFLVLLPNFQGSFFQSLRASFRIAAENPRLALINFAGTLILSASAIVLLPGLGGAVLYQNNVREILRRLYEQKESQPGTKPDWKELMAPEIAVLQKRDFHSLLRPWK